MKMLQVYDAEDNGDDKNGEIVIREAYLSMLLEGLKRLISSIHVTTCSKEIISMQWNIVNKTKLR